MRLPTIALMLGVIATPAMADDCSTWSLRGVSPGMSFGEALDIKPGNPKDSWQTTGGQVGKPDWDRIRNHLREELGREPSEDESKEKEHQLRRSNSFSRYLMPDMKATMAAISSGVMPQLTTGLDKECTMAEPDGCVVLSVTLKGSLKSIGTYEEVLSALRDQWGDPVAEDYFLDVDENASDVASWIDKTCSIGALVWKKIEPKLTGSGTATVIRIRVADLDTILRQSEDHREEVRDRLFGD